METIEEQIRQEKTTKSRRDAVIILVAILVVAGAVSMFRAIRCAVASRDLVHGRDGAHWDSLTTRRTLWPQPASNDGGE